MPDATGLIERSEDLESIGDGLDAAASGDGILSFVSGRAGIGKTSLLLAAKKLGRSRGFAVLDASGVESERGFPFGVVRQLYRRLYEDSRCVGSRKAIAPVFAPPAGEDTASDVSFQVLDGLYWLVSDLSEETPLLLAIDDVHWCDEPSLRHLAYLCRRLEGMRASLLLVERSGEPASPPLEELRELATKQIELAPLSTVGIGEMVRRMLDKAPSAGFLAACLQQTGGYPLYVGELLRALSESGVAPDDAAISRLENVDAGRLARHVWRRVEALGSDAVTVVGLIAVLGGAAVIGRIAQLGDLSAPRIVEIADALVARGVLQAGEPLGFAHPIVRAAVEARLAAGDVDRWHREAARLLDREGADVHEVATHLLRCRPEGDLWAAERLREAALGALRRGAPEAAARELRRALAEGPPKELRISLLCELARAEDAAGEPSAALARYEDALRFAGDAAARAEIAIARAQILSIVDPGGEEAIAALDAALRALDGSDPELEQRIDAELIAFALLSRGARRRGLERLARYGGEVPDGPAAQAVLAATAFGSFLSGRPAVEAVPLAERALRVGGFRRDGFCIEAWTLAAWLLILLDRPHVAESFAERELPTVRRQGHRRENFALEITLAFAALLRGDLPTAISRTQATLVRPDPGAHKAWTYGLMALALLEAGDTAGAERALSESSPEHWGEGVRGSATLYYARAQLRMEQNRLADADEDVEEMRRRSEAAAGLRGFEDLWRPLSARLAHRRGDVERARAVAAEAVEYGRRVDAVGFLGPMLRTAALVGEPEEAVEMLRESVELLGTSRYRLDYAHSLVELGAALRRRGERAAAREPLAEGLDLAYRCGAGRTVSRALGELRASGARPRRPVLTGADALTPAETRIALMAADGRSNREIAQELFVSLKTVEGTLGRAYAKLGISGRGAREALPEALAPLRQGS